MKPLKYLNKFFFKYKKLFVLGIVFIFIANIFALFPAEFVRKAFDSLSISQNKSEVSIIILKYSGLIILYSILKGIFMYCMRQTIIVMSRKIEFELKNEIYNQYQKLSHSFYKKNKIGDLMNRISEDVSRVRMYVGPGVMYAINISILFSLVLYRMFSINITLSIYVLIPLPILALAVYYVSNKINLRSEQVLKQLSKLTTIAQETYSGVKLIKSFSNESNKLDVFLKSCKDYTKRQLFLVKIEAVFFPLIITLIGASTILTVYIGGLEVIKGRITTGNIAEFIIYINMLAWPIASIGWVTSLVQRAAASQQRINNFLLLSAEIKNIKSPINPNFNSIVFKNVGLTYDNTKITALSNINFEINHGEKIGIFGKTGSGKTTICNLICRFYDCDSGEINLANTDIKKVDIFSLRKKIGYIPQDDYLFSGSIRENIIFGSDVFDEDKMIKAAKQAEIFEEINNLSHGFNTKIGERGVQLSGGQKQRLAIARAFYKSPYLYILDDCLSAVDANKEKNILNNLSKLSKKKINIIVSHRVKSIKNSDKIIVLKNGEITELGTHKELIKFKGTYYKAYMQQSQN